MVSEPLNQTRCSIWEVKVQFIAKTGHYPSMSQAHVHCPCGQKVHVFIHRGLWQFMMWSYHMLHVYQVDRDFQMSKTLQFWFRAFIASNIAPFFLLQILIIASVIELYCSSQFWYPLFHPDLRPSSKCVSQTKSFWQVPLELHEHLTPPKPKTNYLRNAFLQLKSVFLAILNF